MSPPISLCAVSMKRDAEEEEEEEIASASQLIINGDEVRERERERESYSPKGLRVLLVDGDTVCLSLIHRLLTQCDYSVTSCSSISEAVALVTERRERFDIVLCDVYLPGEDGFQLLEIVTSASTDLPIIMMSETGETSVVMKGIMKGACDFLIKPLRIEELRNIWQHIVRLRHCKSSKTKSTTRPRTTAKFETKSQGSSEDEEAFKAVDSIESISSLTMMSSFNNNNKRKNCYSPLSSQQNHPHMIQDITGLKKARVHWTVQLHHQFVKAVNQLGLDKAVPKRILEIMNVQGLTRENVASHLQKYRLHLKRLNGSVPQPCPVASFQAAADGQSGGKLQIRPRHYHSSHHPRNNNGTKIINNNNTVPETTYSSAASSTDKNSSNSNNTSSNNSNKKKHIKENKEVRTWAEGKQTTHQQQCFVIPTNKNSGFSARNSLTSENVDRNPPLVNEEEVQLLDNLAEQCGFPLPSVEEDFKREAIVNAQAQAVTEATAEEEEICLAEYFLADFLHHQQQQQQQQSQEY